MTPTQSFLDGQLRIFAKEFVRHRAQDIVKSRRDGTDLVTTSALLRSLYAKVHSDLGRGIYFLTVFFRTYGRLQDMRRRYSKAGGKEMIDLLTEWVLDEGIEKFQKGRFAQAYKDEPPQRIANRIAWGITRNLTKVKGTKKKGWWNTGKTRDIEQFYDVLLRGYRDAVLAEIAATVTN